MRGFRKLNKKKIYKIEKKLEKYFKFLSSLQFAVINLIHLAFLCAIGTFLESYYDHRLARLLIYDSIWMKIALSLLSINLMAVLVDRWPWKKRHIGFVMAHFGILFLIAGSFVTQIKGIDGSLRLALGEKNKSIVLPSEIIVVYASFDGKKTTRIYRDQPVFLLKRPKKEKPYNISLGSDSMQIIDYYPYAVGRAMYQSDVHGNTVIHFRLSGERANISDWIYKEKFKPFLKKKVGLAHIVISDGEYVSKERNELILTEEDNENLSYILVSKGQIQKKGRIKKGEKIKTGWMDLDFHLIDFYKARKIYQFDPKKTPNNQTTSAVKIQFEDQIRWLSLNSFLYFYKENYVYIVGYMNEKFSLNLDIQLENFKIKRYPGSLKAKEYESLVIVDESEKKLISMNQPLKYKGWTFYQSSFEEDDQGQIQSSILSVNKDPGRFIKYFGAFLIVIGVFVLVFFRKSPF